MVECHDRAGSDIQGRTKIFSMGRQVWVAEALTFLKFRGGAEKLGLGEGR